MNNITKNTLQNILKASKIGFCTLNNEANIIEYNQIFSDLFFSNDTQIQKNSSLSYYLNNYTYRTWFNNYFLKSHTATVICDSYMFITHNNNSIWCKFTLQRDTESQNILFIIEDISKQHLELQEAHAQIEKLQEEKEYYIQSSIKKKTLLKTQDSLMINQAKLAGMGEMIGAIAHQWKQPLAKINSMLVDIQLLCSGNEKFELLSIKLDHIEDLTENMADTIEDFRNYINPQKQKTIFSFESVLEDSLKIFSSTMENNNIKIETHFTEKVSLEGYKKEFMQVLLIFFNNSKDAFKEKKITNPIIQISTSQNGDNKIIKIKDNAGGVKADILEKVFEPYFSTKQHQGGTGLGLYMAKLLIEDSMNSKLKISSVNNTTTISIIQLKASAYAKTI